MFGWFKKKPKHMEPKPQEEVKIDDEEDKDIDPDQIALPDVPENKDKIITDVTNIDYPGYSEMNKDQMLETMLAFK